MEVRKDRSLTVAARNGRCRMANRKTRPFRAATVRERSVRGQAAIEFTLLYGLVFVPLIFGIVFVSEMYWTWHSMAEFTREGARYAATHCWQGDANNVVNYMQTHVPPVIDFDQFRSG